MAAMGREFVGVDKKMAPNKQYIDMKMGDTVVFKTVFDGKTGIRAQMGNKKDFDAEEIKKYDDTKGPVSHLYFNSCRF
jgi:hypothetical protein